VSHLESENQQLKRSVGKLERENRAFEDRLVQEQIDNGDLAARLDDARNLLADRGIEADVRVGSRRGRDDFRGSSGEDDRLAPRTLPAGQRTKQRRKPPVAKISGPVSTIPPIDEDSPPRTHRKSGRNPKVDRSARELDDAQDRPALENDTVGWRPITAEDGPRASRLR
jgi:hypothetical protein